VEFSDVAEWWDGLTAAEQKSVDFTVSLLQQCGQVLRMPHSSGVETSRHAHMRELRIQHEGRPSQSPECIRPTLVEDYVPLADAIYDCHVRELDDD
jgi:hypothetical protein